MFPRWLIVFLLLALPASSQSKSAPSKSPARPDVFSQITEITATLSEITGWKPREKVRSEVLTRAQFHKFVESQTHGRGATREIRAEEISLKMFGFVPQDYNLATGVADVLDEQAAAFYDYKRKRLFILDSTPAGDDQRDALVHELAHALADQRHPLGKYLGDAGDDNDAATAREAVMEGQATWLTWAYETKHMGGAAEVSPQMIDRLTADNSDNSDFPVLSASPLYVRESLLFPYNAGARFQDAIYRKLGRGAFEAVFANGPKSTQQILHPEDYLDHKLPSMPEPPAPFAAARDESPKQRDRRIAHAFDVLIEGDMGEFDHSVLLQQYADDAPLAQHLRGGAFRIYEAKHEARGEAKHEAARTKSAHSAQDILAYVSEWDSPESAREYFAAYEKILRGKWKHTQVDSRTASEIKGAGDSGKFILRIQGAKVESVEGLQ